MNWKRLFVCVGIAAFAAASWVWPGVPIGAGIGAVVCIFFYGLRLFLYPNE